MDIHVVDGTYELFRAYYGAPSQMTSTGQEVGATRAFLGSMLRILTVEGATHVGIAFDTVIESFRNDLYDGYKTGDGIDPDLWSQFPLVEAGAEALGFVVWRMIDFEADDALATCAALVRDAKNVDRVFLCTPDKDLGQCVVDDRVVLHDRRRKKTYDHDGIVEKFGVEPQSIPDYLALVGDDADGIPGIPRWGAKSTSNVLQTYKHIDAIPLDATRWPVRVRGAATLVDNLRDEYDEALLYRTLATLRTDVPLDIDVERLFHRGAERERLQAFADLIEWPVLVSRCPHFCD